MKKQLSFEGMEVKKPPREFGGKKSHPKIARPLTTKSCMHITLRSSMAKGSRSFLTKGKLEKIRDTINRQAELFNIKLYNFSINSNHIHLLMKLQDRDSYRKFIRGLTGTIARIALEAKKGNAKANELIENFWDTRPFSKIVNWGRHYVNTYFYVFENELEAAGFIKYRDRKNKGSPAT